MASLFELAAEFRGIAEKLEESDLPPEVIRDTLDGCALDFEEKAVNVAAFIRNIEATADAIKAAEKQQAERRKALENRAAGLREYLLYCMKSTNIAKVENPLFKLAIRKNPASVIIDGEVPAEFMKLPEPPAPVPDKAAIKAAIEAGQTVPGAHLAQGERVDIR